MVKKHTSGFDEFRARARAARKALPEAIKDELVKSAERVRTQVVADIRTQKIPAGYEGKRKGGPGRRRHIPSPPWGPPNSDTGNLAARYTTDSGSMATFVWARIVAGVRYARWLEEGTRRMLPRPHLLSRFETEVTKLKDRLGNLVKGG